MGIISILIFLLTLLVFFGIQIYLCKNVKNKKIGLILPVGSFLILTMPLIAMIVNFLLMYLNKDNLHILSLIKSALKIEYLPTYILDLFSLLILIVITYLPTVVFTLIYIYYKNKEIKA